MELFKLMSSILKLETVLMYRLCLQTPGNYEFTKGSTGLGLFLDNIDFPVLGCNIDTTKEPILNGRIRANTMVLNNKVGIIGYTTTSVPNIVLNSKWITSFGRPRWLICIDWGL